MDNREDGEILETDEEAYKIIVRPVPPEYRNCPLENLSDDELNSDSDLPQPKRICDNNLGNKSVISRHKNKGGQLWVNFLQEESLMQTMANVQVNKVKKTERSIESYQIPNRTGNSSHYFKHEIEKNKWNKRSAHHNSEAVRQKNGAEKMVEERELKNIENEEEFTDEQLGKVMARALKEEKSDLIIKIIKVLGRDATLRLYKKTQLVEGSGGILVFNGSRRRTSGGVFLNLLKTFEGITKANILEIFFEEKEIQVVRKRQRCKRRRANFVENGFSVKEISEMEEINAKYFPEENEDINNKCPGSTPVPSPQCSDSEGITMNVSTDPVQLVEACNKAAKEGRI